MGLSIPILRSTDINFGITHFENFGNFATEDKVGSEKSNLEGDAPSVTFGIGFNIPKIINSDNDMTMLQKTQSGGIYAQTDSSILYFDPII